MKRSAFDMTKASVPLWLMLSVPVLAFGIGVVGGSESDGGGGPGILGLEKWDWSIALYNKDEDYEEINYDDITYPQQDAVWDTAYIWENWQWRHYYDFDSYYLEYNSRELSYGGCSLEQEATGGKPIYWWFHYPWGPSGDWSTTQVKFHAKQTTVPGYTTLYAWLDYRHYIGGLYWSSWATAASSDVRIYIYS